LWIGLFVPECATKELLPEPEHAERIKSAAIALSDLNTIPALLTIATVRDRKCGFAKR